MKYKNVTMEEEVLREIMKECNIGKRKAEELLKVSLFYGDTYKEAVENIKKFCLCLNNI